LHATFDRLPVSPLAQEWTSSARTSWLAFRGQEDFGMEQTSGRGHQDSQDENMMPLMQTMLYHTHSLRGGA